MEIGSHVLGVEAGSVDGKVGTYVILPYLSSRIVAHKIGMIR